MELILVKIISYLLLPPGLMFVGMLIGLLLRRRWPRIALTFILTSIILLVLCSLPIVMDPLFHYAEDLPTLTPTQQITPPAQAIVILGGGKIKNAPEYHSDTLSNPSTNRVRYASHLQKLTHLPILATGGSVYDDSESEASIIKRVIETEFGGKVQWTETRSRTTQENAIYTYAMLQQENITHIILVTHALHMRRSQSIFEKAGFVVTPAPMGFHVPAAEPRYMGILPHAEYLVYSRELAHEWLGRIWYKIRY